MAWRRGGTKTERWGKQLTRTEKRRAFDRMVRERMEEVGGKLEGGERNGRTTRWYDNGQKSLEENYVEESWCLRLLGNAMAKPVPSPA